jgi:hypothetical protein
MVGALPSPPGLRIHWKFGESAMALFSLKR